MRSTAILATIVTTLPFAYAAVQPRATQSAPQAPPVSTSYSTVGTLLFTNGNRVPTTISVPIPITLSQSAPASSTGGSNSGSGGGGSSSDFRNATITQSGGNNTQIQSSITSTSSTPTTLPIAPTSIEYGGGGTTVPAPVPGGSGGLPQGPSDSHHSGAALPNFATSVVGIVIGVGSIAAVQYTLAL